MRILITGAGGLVGGRLATLLSTSHETTALIRRAGAPDGVPSVSADLIDPKAVESALRAAGADTVIHCAALADPETCEREPARARRDNVDATRTLAAACRAQGTRLILISTDLVYDGTAAFSTELSATGPLMEYGRSKLGAENAAIETCPDSVVLRIALVCGQGYGRRWSASEGIAHRLKQGEPVTLFDDEWRTPIDPESVAEAIATVLGRPGVSGRFHLGGLIRLTRYELGATVGALYGLDRSLLRRATRSSHPGAPRPRDVSLDIGLAQATLDWSPRPLTVALREGRTG